MSSILTLLTLILGILEKFVSWGAQTKVFDEHQSIIALTILRKAQGDIKVAQDIEDTLNRDFTEHPDLVQKPDEFTRDSADRP